MSYRAFRYHFTALIAFASLAIAAIVSAVDRACSWLVNELSAAPLNLRLADEPSLVIVDGNPLRSDLLQSLRHEAGVPRLSAARGC